MGITKLISIFVIILSAFYSFSYPSESKSEDFSSFQLENKMKVVVINKKSLPLVNIVLAVNVGSKDETIVNNGTVHLLEHLILFRREFSRKVRAHGGYFNGHTDRDLAIFEISLPAKELEFGLSVLKEMIFEFKVSSNSLEKEKKVIEREFKQIKDDPVRFGRSLALQHLFTGHPYSLPVSGDLNVIQKSDAATIEGFYKKYFYPGNCALAIVGNVHPPDAEMLVKRLMEKIPKSELKDMVVPPQLKLKKHIEVTHTMDVEKSHVIFAYPAPRYNHDDQMTVRILTQVLGGGINPIMGGVFRGRRRLVDKISMRYIPMLHGGAVLIHMELDPKDIKLVRTRLRKFFQQITQFRFSPRDYLPGQRRDVFDYVTTAKNQIKVSTEEYLERGLNHAAAFTRFLLLNKKAEKNSHRKKKMEKVNSKLLRKSVSQYFNGKKYVLIKIFPNKES
jgi:predicted Zn-dependent peptidase